MLFRKFYLVDWTSLDPVKLTPKQNGTIHTDCKTILNVVSLEAEYETCVTFNNVKIAIGMQPALITLDHKKIATPIQTENSTTEGFFNYGMIPKRSKTCDMKTLIISKSIILQLIIFK